MTAEHVKALLEKVKDDDLKEYFKMKSGGWEHNSYLNNLQILIRFQDYIREVSPDNPRLIRATTSDIANYRQYCLDVKGNSRNSVDTYETCIRTFYNYLFGEGKSDNPMTTLEPIKVEEKVVVYLNDEEIERLCNAADNPRDKALIMTLRYTGFRRSEIVKMKKKDIDFENLKIKIMAKGSKERYHPIPPELVEPLKSYCACFQPDQPIFDVSLSTITLNVGALGKKANITKEVTPHVIRHSYGRYLRRKGCSPQQVQRLLGHRSLTTTMRYFELEDEGIDDIIKDAFKKE